MQGLEWELALRELSRAVAKSWCIFRCQNSEKFLQSSYKVPTKFLPGFTLHQFLRVDNLLYLCLDVLQVPLGQAQVPSQVARVWS